MWPTLRLVIFLAATAFLAFWSRAALKQTRSHGFIRFFVFEAIVVLVLLQVPTWFVEAGAPHQLASWFLLIVSFLPLTLGVYALHRYGHARDDARREPELLEFERTTRLVQEGIFRVIRHPMYCSLLLLVWGVVLKAPGWVTVGLGALVTAGLLLMARRDEEECKQAFGAPYAEYMRHTRRFIPYVY